MYLNQCFGDVIYELFLSLTNFLISLNAKAIIKLLHWLLIS